MRMAIPVKPRMNPLSAVKMPAESCDNQSPFIATDITALAASRNRYSQWPRSPPIERNVRPMWRGRVTQIHHTAVVRQRNADTVTAAVHAASLEYVLSSGVGYSSGKAYVMRNDDVNKGKTGKPCTRSEHHRYDGNRAAAAISSAGPAKLSVPLKRLSAPQSAMPAASVQKSPRSPGPLSARA